MYRPPGHYDPHDLGAVAAHRRPAAAQCSDPFPRSSELPEHPPGSPTRQTGYWVSPATRWYLLLAEGPVRAEDGGASVYSEPSCRRPDQVPD